MNLSNKIKSVSQLDASMEHIEVVKVDDLKEAIKELKIQLYKHLEMWESMMEIPAQEQVNYMLNEIFGDKLI